MNHKIAVSLLSLAAFVSVGGVEGCAQTLMTRHVRAVTQNGQAKLVGNLPCAQIMQLDGVLPVRGRAGLHTFLADLRDPNSSEYRRFLTPAEFTERFGPTRQDYDAVVQYLRDFNLAITGGSRDGMDVQV